jgi:hypothetical protein
MEPLKILLDTHKYNKLISSNKHFEIFCAKCFKTAKIDVDMDDMDDIDDQICIILAAKYFFML